MKRIWNRVYSDFLMPSRLDEYEAILKAALAQGYEIHSVISFWRAAQVGLSPKNRYLICRHDIDTDVETADDMFRIERKLGVRATYYFRLSTINVKLMQSIQNEGSEASYHYEELATYAKKHGLVTREQVTSQIDRIRDLFRTNLMELKQRTGLPMGSVASHGDFVNRALGMPNWELLNSELRTELGIEVETYDSSLMNLYSSTHTDMHYPKYWRTESPLLAIQQEVPAVHVLTHPRHWRTAPLENLIDDAKRLYEDLVYRYHSMAHRA